MAAATVHLWNVVFAYYFFFLGLGGWIADPQRQKAAAAPVRTPSARRGRGGQCAPVATMPLPQTIPSITA